MTVPNRISAQMSAEDMNNIRANLKSTNDAMPWLVGLSVDERVRMNKAGDASQAFIRKCVETAPLVLNDLPRSFDVEEFRRDIELMDQLQSLIIQVSALHEKLSDTRAVVASEAYSAALEVYRVAKQTRGVKGLDQVVRELGRRFARSSASPPPPDEGAADEPSEPRPKPSTEPGDTQTG